MLVPRGFIIFAASFSLASSSGDCVDDASWEDDDGFGCASYREEDWCDLGNPPTYDGPAWDSSRGSVPDGALQSCCECGANNTNTTEPEPAPSPEPDAPSPEPTPDDNSTEPSPDDDSNKTDPDPTPETKPSPGDVSQSWRGKSVHLKFVAISVMMWRWAA